MTQSPIDGVGTRARRSEKVDTYLVVKVFEQHRDAAGIRARPRPGRSQSERPRPSIRLLHCSRCHQEPSPVPAGSRCRCDGDREKHDSPREQRKCQASPQVPSITRVSPRDRSVARSYPQDTRQGGLRKFRVMPGSLGTPVLPPTSRPREPRSDAADRASPRAIPKNIQAGESPQGQVTPSGPPRGDPDAGAVGLTARGIAVKSRSSSGSRPQIEGSERGMSRIVEVRPKPAGIGGSATSARRK